MSYVTHTVSGAIRQLVTCDPILNYIMMYGEQYTDEDLAKLVDAMLIYPNFITHIYLGDNLLSDKTGVKLARYVAISSTIQVLNLCNNQISEVTELAMAAALRINTSLRSLFLYRYQPISSKIDSAFADALILNPNRPPDSTWCLYKFVDDFKRLKIMAEKLGHPNMQSILTMWNN